MEKDLYEKLVNINKATKVTKDINMFILIPISENVNLVSTRYFILNLGDEQFWKMQCKLEAKKYNVWLYKCKEGITEAKDMAAAESVKKMYFDALKLGEVEQLESTGLSYSNGTRIYTDGLQYFGLAEKYLEMFTAGMPTVKKISGNGYLLIDDVHIVAPVNLKATEYESKFLKEASSC